MSKYVSASGSLINDLCAHFLYFWELRICTWLKNSFKQSELIIMRNVIRQKGDFFFTKGTSEAYPSSHQMFFFFFPVPFIEHGYFLT